MESALFVDLSDKNRLIREEAGANAIRSTPLLSKHCHRDGHHLPDRRLYQIGQYLSKELPPLRRNFRDSPTCRPDELSSRGPLSMLHRRLHLRGGDIRQQPGLRLVRGVWHAEGQMEVNRRDAGAKNWRLAVHFQEQLHLRVWRACRPKADCGRDWGVRHLSQRLVGNRQLVGG